MTEERRKVRLRALEGCLGILDAMQRMVGANWTLLTPRPGLEPFFDDLEERRSALRELMAEERERLDAAQRRRILDE